MSFLGMGPFEIIIILLVAFIFLGPERMADAARTLGKWTSELRRATAGVRAEMDDLIADDPTPPPQPAQPTRATQTRPANAYARLPDETHPNAPIDPSAAAHTAGDEVAPNAATDADAPVPFRSARANPPQPAAPPKPPSDAAPTPDASPNRAPTEDNP